MDAGDLRRRIDAAFGWFRYFTEIAIDEIADRLKEGPMKIMAIGVVSLLFLSLFFLLFSHKPEPPKVKPKITAEEQAINIAKKQYPYGKVGSTLNFKDVWYVYMDLPLPILVPDTNMTTKEIVVRINATSENFIVLTPDWHIIKKGTER